MFGGQIRYTAPFGFSSACYVLRAQADQWVAAALFTLHSFAAFSIAAILGQVVNIFRASVVEAFMPSMSRMEAAGDARSMMEMNARANAMVGMLLLPLLGFVFAFAEDIVSLVYTASYVNAAAVMRVYIVGLTALVVELSTVLQLLRQGPFSLAMNIVVLAISVPLSWYGGVHLGLPRVAAELYRSARRLRVFTMRPVTIDPKAVVGLVCAPAETVAARLGGEMAPL